MTTEPNASKPSPGPLPPNHNGGDNLPSNGLDFEPEYHGINLEDIMRVPHTPFALQDQRDKAMTKLLALQIERGSLKTQLEEAEEANQSLRDTLDKVRRELAEARMKLKQRDPDTALQTLAERVSDLEDVVYPLGSDGQPVGLRARKEVFTLVQRDVFGGGHDDRRLAAMLNEGWTVLNFSAGERNSAIWRAITLVRDVHDDASGDDDRVEVALPKDDDAESAPPEPAVTPVGPAIIIEPPDVPEPALNEALDHPVVQAIRQNGSDAVIADANRELLQVAEAAYELRRTHVVRRPPVPTFLLPERI